MFSVHLNIIVHLNGILFLSRIMSFRLSINFFAFVYSTLNINIFHKYKRFNPFSLHFAAQCSSIFFKPAADHLRLGQREENIEKDQTERKALIKVNLGWLKYKFEQDRLGRTVHRRLQLRTFIKVILVLLLFLYVSADFFSPINVPLFNL